MGQATPAADKAVPTPYARAYLITVACALFGGAFGFLGMTSATTAAGAATGQSGWYTALVSAVLALATAVGAAFTAHACRALGTIRLMMLAQALAALIWIVAGLMLVRGSATMQVLLIANVPLGLVSGVTIVLIPGLARAFLGGASTSTAYARSGVVSGVAFAAGSLVAGGVLAFVNLGWGLVVDGLLLIPQALLMRRLDPSHPPPAPGSTVSPWRAVREGAAQSVVMRRLLMASVATALLITPFGALVTPIVDGLRPGAPVVGAGAVLSALSIGALGSPRVLRQMRRTVGERRGVFVAAGFAGLTLALFGAVGLLPPTAVQLLLLLVVSVLIGAGRQAYNSLRSGLASEARGGDHQLADVASVNLVSRLLLPVGAIVWGIMIDRRSESGTMIALGLIMAVVGVLMARSMRRVELAEESAA